MGINNQVVHSNPPLGNDSSEAGVNVAES